MDTVKGLNVKAVLIRGNRKNRISIYSISREPNAECLDKLLRTTAIKEEVYESIIFVLEEMPMLNGLVCNIISKKLL